MAIPQILPFLFTDVLVFVLFRHRSHLGLVIFGYLLAVMLILPALKLQLV